MKRGADRQQIVTEEAEVVGGVARQPGWAGDVASDAACDSIGQIGRMKKRISRTSWPDQRIESCEAKSK